MAGNHKVTTQTKIIRGTFRKDRHGKKMLVRNEVELPVPPKEFRKSTQAHWFNVCRTLQEQGVLQSIGIRLLQAYFEQVEQYEDAREDIKARGLTISYVSPRYGEQENPNPSVKIANDSLRAMIQLSALFGLTPLAQTRINTNHDVKDKAEEADEFDNI